MGYLPSNTVRTTNGTQLGLAPATPSTSGKVMTSNGDGTAGWAAGGGGGGATPLGRARAVVSGWSYSVDGGGNSTARPTGWTFEGSGGEYPALALQTDGAAVHPTDAGTYDLWAEFLLGFTGASAPAVVMGDAFAYWQTWLISLPVAAAGGLYTSATARASQYLGTTEVPAYNPDDGASLGFQLQWTGTATLLGSSLARLYVTKRA